MSFTRRGLIGGLALLAACQDPATPIADRSIEISPARRAAVAGDESPSQLAVAQVVPGFGGYFIDAGAPTVYLTDVAQRDAAASALATFLASYGWDTSDLVVREARYDYLQLSGWYQLVSAAALRVTGAVFGDIDEANNRLAFGGLDAAAIQGIAGAVSQAGVPAGAVAVQLSGPVTQAATLRDRTRPPYGGLQIQFFPTPASPLVLLCTLGFNAIDGVDTSFVTNSHCSNVQGGTTLPTDYYQATRGGAVADPANFIAREAEDPDYTIGGACPAGRRCRTSDASRARYSAGSPFVLGRLARAAQENTTGTTLADTITIDAASPHFSITAEQQRSVLGQTLNKVGRTTGWTSGPVVATCVDVNITASEITQLCQDLVDAHVAGGDSGSPVFGEHTDGTAFLAGILWGSSTNLQTGDVRFIMSPLESIKNEIGAIKTFDPPVDSKKKTKKVK